MSSTLEPRLATDPEAHLVTLVRLSPDITTKSDRTRRRFMRRLVDNLRDAFRTDGITARVDPGWVRLVFESDDRRALEVASRVFGVHSLSAVEPRAVTTLDALVDDAATWFLPAVRGKTFAVRARTGGTAPFTSRESHCRRRRQGGNPSLRRNAEADGYRRLGHLPGRPEWRPHRLVGRFAELVLGRRTPRGRGGH